MQLGVAHEPLAGLEVHVQALRAEGEPQLLGVEAAFWSLALTEVVTSGFDVVTDVPQAEGVEGGVSREASGVDKVDEDLEQALATYGEGTAAVRRGAVLMIDLFLEPSNLVPSEVCKAWGWVFGFCLLVVSCAAYAAGVVV